MYEEMIMSHNERSNYAKTQVRTSSTSTNYTFKIINYPNSNPLLEVCPFHLLEHIDFKIIDKPVILIEPSGRQMGIDYFTSDKRYEPVKCIIKGIKFFEAEINWGSPLIACVGISESR
ncbi:MAG: hypothetical protein QXE79_03785, partial [Candidatus Bathyarchaeia archaeon]